jgi:hypothetical protein
VASFSSGNAVLKELTPLKKGLVRYFTPMSANCTQSGVEISGSTLKEIGRH